MHDQGDAIDIGGLDAQQKAYLESFEKEYNLEKDKTAEEAGNYTHALAEVMTKMGVGAEEAVKVLERFINQAKQQTEKPRPMNRADRRAAERRAKKNRARFQ